MQHTMKLFPFDLMMLVHYGTYIGSTACFFRRETVVGQGFLLNIDFRVNMDGRILRAPRQRRETICISTRPARLLSPALGRGTLSLADYALGI